jgi:hypothetical protein
MSIRLYSFILIMLCGLISYAQKLVFEELPDKIFEPPVFGIKGKHYLHFYYEAGVPIGSGEDDSLDTRNWKSGCWNFGIRYKLALKKRLSLNVDLGYNFHSFYIRQAENNFPDTLRHNKEKINLNQASGAMSLRYVFSRKKKFFGKYAAIGGMASWNFSTAHYTKDVYPAPGSPYDKYVVRIRQRNPKYLAPYELNLFAALALEKVEMRLYYRLTDLFVEYNGKKAGELPAMIIALNFAIAGNK